MVDLSEIEDGVAAHTISAAQVFTRLQSRITQLEEEYAEYKATMEALHVQAKATIAELQRKYESLGDNVDFHVGQLEQDKALLVEALEKTFDQVYDNPAIDALFERVMSQVADSKECEHGKGLTDYCQPCGRVNGG